ncbi:hypothetical protein CBR_g39537 [Chara braunii]|uniref:Phospholipase D n=1 Tax=Chara braunii TaxID=69332 RepID=A0A388LS93_CHABU|nr:hypothetical protein CBR_g39537 [Chara braunii]|eukprot:GBG85073.1 hypothetical protein CBR_g39537 [Chara braunii]
MSFKIPFGGLSRSSSSPRTSIDGSYPNVLLHGKLLLTVSRARNVPKVGTMATNLMKSSLGMFSKVMNVGSKLTEAVGNHSDPYVVVDIAGARVARTCVINNCENPQWNETFSIYVAHFTGTIDFTIKDQNLIGAGVVGTVRVPVEALAVANQPKGGSFEILKSDGSSYPGRCLVDVSCHYKPAQSLPGWYFVPHMAGQIVPAFGYLRSDSAAAPGVPGTYFPLRRGCRVTLYQDAHVADGALPESIRLDGGRMYTHGRCWEDICAAIQDAKFMIYIIGWSVYDKIKLIRDPRRPMGDGSQLTLGELLKKKAGANVRVLLMIWDDNTSRNNEYMKQGVMNVHDEETKAYFRHSAVKCVLAKRTADSNISMIGKMSTAIQFTHHQKAVLVDVDDYTFQRNAPPVNMRQLTHRRVAAFIGGIDLCNGRYDNQSHPLFHTLHVPTHGEDYYQGCIPSATLAHGGPRQPWHDIHCRLEGPAAYDVLKNFTERWEKSAHRFDDSLLELKDIQYVLSPAEDCPREGDPRVMVTHDSQPDSWHVQVFRSIDSGSVRGWPTNQVEVRARGLLSGKGVIIERSVQDAYINAIRSAQHFVYIENQYFMGSSYMWATNRSAGCDNLIPAEIALKIVDKIRQNERFAAYIVIPMFPEGAPDSGVGQTLLYWQYQTIEMMYKLIRSALIETGKTNSHPQEYLNFFCLANREAPVPNEPRRTTAPQPNSPLDRAYHNRRFMIYVHSKMMIVDDEYVIVGSANINQRSMDGTRDTEIAMGAFQPRYTVSSSNGRTPRSDVYGFRLSLWAEHLGGHFMPEFNEPSSLECVNRVRGAAAANWQDYMAPNIVNMRGHLCPYPIRVEMDGSVRTLPGVETFPDLGGKILGGTAFHIPEILTT